MKLKQIINLSYFLASIFYLPTNAATPRTSIKASEVVVTARKRAEKIEEVPVSTKVFDSKELKAY